MSSHLVADAAFAPEPEERGRQRDSPPHARVGTATLYRTSTVPSMLRLSPSRIVAIRRWPDLGHGREQPEDPELQMPRHRAVWQELRLIGRKTLRSCLP
jgi:hypothetical protein